VSRIAIIAAMPGELKPLVKGWKSVPTGQRFVYKWIATFGENECVAVCAGMGTGAATKAFALAERDMPLDAVVSIGWAGALKETGYAGQFLIPNIVVNAQTGERYTLAEREKPVVLVTAMRVADEAEKRRLAATYGGALVDMESATVARLAHMRGIPLCCMKVITDEVTVRLPDLNNFIDRRGQMQMAKFIPYVLLRPKFWPALMRLGTASTTGAEKIAAALNESLSKLTPQAIEIINQSGGI
jgi:adenosylhomocysteine nucleosidase